MTNYFSLKHTVVELTAFLAMSTFAVLKEILTRINYTDVLLLFALPCQ